MSARPDTDTHPNTAKPRARPRLLLAVTLLLLAVTLIGVLDLPQTDWYRERRYSHMALFALEREHARHAIEDPILLYYLGRRYNDLGQFAKADPVLRQAVGLDPETPRLRDEWTRALLGSGLTTAAFGQLREYAGTHPHSAPAHLILGKFYVTQHSMRRASEELERAVVLDPRLAEGWTYLTIAQEGLNNLGPAVEAGAKAVALRPDDVGNRLRLADLQMRTDQPEVARQNYERAIALAPNSGKPQREYARWLLSVSPNAHIRQAVEMAQQAATQMPNDADAQLLLGRALLQNSRPEAALAPLQQAAKLAPNDPTPLLLLTQALHKLGREAEAQTSERAYMQRQQRSAATQSLIAEALRHPDATEPQRRLAHLSAQQGDVEGCVRYYARALRHPLDSPQTLVAAANDLTESGFATEALPLARRAVGVGTHSPAAHEALGNVLLVMGQAHEAATEYATAATWWPTRFPAYQARLARFSLTHQEGTPPTDPAEQAFLASRDLMRGLLAPIRIPTEALVKAHEAVRLAPQNPIYLKHLLTLLFLQHENTEAIAVANKLLAVSPQDSKAHALLGLLLVGQAADETTLRLAETHLQQADAPDSEATREYGLGLIAMARKQGDAAIVHLKRAVVLDPEPDVAYYKLALAYNLAERDAEARRAMALYRRRRAEREAESVALHTLGQHDSDPKAYAQAAALFEAHGRHAQAQAILEAAPGKHKPAPSSQTLAPVR
jgi:tetratricopeptide (TPR) repeat protein